MKTRILCCTDLLPKSESALDRAGMLAEELQAELSLLHVVAPAESHRFLEQDLADARWHLRARARPPQWRFGPAPNVFVRTGARTSVLLEVAKELEPALIVLGTPFRRPARDALSGTLVARLLSSLACPVLIVRRMPWEPYRDVVLALDGTDASIPVLRAAEALVVNPATRGTVVHAYEHVYDGMLTSAGVSAEAIGTYAQTWKSEAGANVSDLLSRGSEDPSRYRVLLENAPAITAIHNAVAERTPGLAVLGTRGHGRLRRAFLGSVANSVLYGTDCDVLIVPHRTRLAGLPSKPANDGRAAGDAAAAMR